MSTEAFERKMERICKNFKFSSLSEEDKEYLVGMFNQVSLTLSNPKNGKPFELEYPNRRNYRFYVDKLPKTYNSSVSGNYGSHLLNGTKYYIAWDYGHDNDKSES
jgi:hypothetical protein